ncbi:ABC transporter ATP-binding protein [Demequina sediminicola]|uniref:ABC transporter ATP-binding protein n=1 Tax=Demequina sediminicola TaxID=1095026 RepID=UPI000780691D|nr:ATP-binding cassette domain-containing protein [Demequina sediminicola]
MTTDVSITTGGEGRSTAATPAGAPGAESPATITVENYSVEFAARGNGKRHESAVRVLEDVSLTIKEREFVAILGPSGCGKSTLLRAMGGLLDERATIHGAVTSAAPTAWMPQHDCLLPWRRAMSNAMVGAIAAGVPRDRAALRAAELFEEFGLAGFERAWPHEMSGGMRQRLALLRTCLSERPVLLLDEPFGALDPLTRRHMNAWLAGLNLASTVVLVTHDVDEAIMLADRIVVLSGRPGRIIHETRAHGSGRFEREELLAALGVGGAHD